MSPREKKLLIYFAFAAFVIVNFLGLRYFIDTRAKIVADHTAAKGELDQARIIRNFREEVAPDMEWLEAHKPKPMAVETVQAAVQAAVTKEVTAVGLTLKTQNSAPAVVDPALHYHRVKHQFSVTGTEEALYRWFDRIIIPEQFRTVTEIKLSPNKEEPSQIDCTATVEQWFDPGEAK